MVNEHIARCCCPSCAKMTQRALRLACAELSPETYEPDIIKSRIEHVLARVHEVDAWYPDKEDSNDQPKD